MKNLQKEFLKILTDYQGIIHKVNLAYFRSNMDKQDNFQEIVYQLWRTFPTLINKEKPASWIYAVAINTSISKIRKDSKLKFYDVVPDFTVVEPHEYDENTNYSKLMNALYKLNEIDKSIMLLYLEEFSYEEIAKIVGISVSCVGVKIYRLKDQLQKQLNR
ncbi:MAG: RNA polymerase sigma factor [Bacteroides graminisolvens]|uniref:RNA polymerase sigma factor n=1 Tax=Bacteroides graminisolvens TaxID=477666 RepID=UPI003A8390DD